MKVKNDFPDVDRVLSKLKKYVTFFNEKKDVTKDSDEKEDCVWALKEVDDFISAIQNYLDSVCNSESRIKIYKEGRESQEIREYVEEEDSNRTRYHSNIISSMIMIDRLAMIYGIDKVFDYAEEFEKNSSLLMPNSISEKRSMTERQRIKRREMGNFGLYIAASVTAGMVRDDRLEDKEARSFASCESDEQIESSNAAFYKVKSNFSKTSLNKNINDMIK